MVATVNATPVNQQLNQLSNIGMIDSVASGILTLAIKQSDGATNASVTNPITVSMRNPTATLGGNVSRSVTGALSLDLQASATLNFIATQSCYLWVYLMDSDGAGGAMKLACSPVRLDDGELTQAVRSSGTVSLPIASPGVVTETGHNRANGDQVMFSNSGGALPTGLVAGTTYWITNVATDTYRLATSPSGTTTGGSAINFTGSQSGTHTVKTVFAAGKVIADAFVTTARPIKLISRHRFNLNSSATWIASTAIAMADTLPAGEVIYMSGNSTDVTSHSAGTQTVIVMASDSQTHSFYNAAGSWFQAPATGKYSVSIHLAFNLATWGADKYVAAGLFVNIANSGTQTTTLGEWVSQDAPGSTTYSNLAATKVISLTAGDFVNIALINGNSAALAMDGVAIDNWITITKVG